MRVLRTILVVPLLAGGISGQAVLGPADFSRDLQAVATRLPMLHVNLFFQTSQADFDAAVRQLQADIPNLSQYQFYTRLSALVALARDGHTALFPSPSAGFVQLPLTLQHFADGYFVTSAPADHGSLNRAKLTGVGGAVVEDVLAALEPVIPHENEYRFQALAAQAIMNLGLMRGLGFLPDTGPATYTFQLDSADETSVDLSTANPAQVRALDSPSGFIQPLDSSTQSYWSAWWPSTQTVYVRIASFRSADGGQQMAAQTLAWLDGNAVINLVIDLRNDEGGDLTVPFPLLEGLTERLAALQSNPLFQIFALVNGGSYSSASVLPMILKAGVPDFLAPFAPGIGAIPTTLVGEPTGGPPHIHGNPMTFTLPASGMLVQYSTVYIPPFPGIPDRDAIYPDITVPVRSTDYFARHDAMLAAVLARASPPPATPTGDALVVNAASLRTGTGIAPGSLAIAFGGFPHGSLSVSVNGEPATVVEGPELVAAGCTTVMFMVPADTATGQATVTVAQNGQTVASGRFTVTAAGPGLFTTATARAQPGLILNQDSSPNSSASTATRGSVVQILGTGYGSLDGTGQAAVNVWIGNLPATVLYSGPGEGVPGVWQINAQVPDDPAIAGQVPMFVGALGMASNGVTLFVAP